MTNENLKQHIAEAKILMEKALGNHERDLLGDILSRIIEPKKLEVLEKDSLVEQISASAVDFEMDHPNLAKSLREVGDTLNKMGV
jgi:hypothetical protein